MEFFKPGRVFDFMGQRVFWIPLSFILVIASTILCFYPGPNYGTDFRGGTEVETTMGSGEFAFGGVGGSFAIRGAIEFPLFGLPWMLEGDYRSYSYPHNNTITPAQVAASADGNPCPSRSFSRPACCCRSRTSSHSGWWL